MGDVPGKVSEPEQRLQCIDSSHLISLSSSLESESPLCSPPVLFLGVGEKTLFCNLPKRIAFYLKYLFGVPEYKLTLLIPTYPLPNLDCILGVQ